jgi:hypothetical protein
MAFDPREWTVQGYFARYRHPNAAIEAMKKTV